MLIKQERKPILAHIFKETITECKDMSYDEIEKCIEGDIQIDIVGLDTGTSNEKISGNTQEDFVNGEGKVTFDIRTFVRIPMSDDSIKESPRTTKRSGSSKNGVRSSEKMERIPKKMMVNTLPIAVNTVPTISNIFVRNSYPCCLLSESINIIYDILLVQLCQYSGKRIMLAGTAKLAKDMGGNC